MGAHASRVAAPCVGTVSKHVVTGVSARLVNSVMLPAVLPMLPMLDLGDLQPSENGGGGNFGAAMRARLIGGRSGLGPDQDDDSMTSSDEPLPLEVARFIATGSGVRWLIDVMKDWPGLLNDARDRIEDTIGGTSATIVQAPKHLNTFVVGEYKKLVRSEMGKRLINRAHGAEAAIADPLSVPLYVVEDIVRLRLHQLVTKNWKTLTVRLCTRVTLMCAAINLVKAGVKRLARRRPRLGKTLAFVCDVLLPTEFYGPLAGITIVVFQGINELIAK